MRRELKILQVELSFPLSS